MEIRVTNGGELQWSWALYDDDNVLVTEGDHPYPRRSKAIAVAERTFPGVSVLADPE